MSQKPKFDASELKQLLVEVGWSGAKLSRQVAVSKSTAYNWLKGRTETPGSVLQLLRLWLGARKLVRELGLIVGAEVSG